MLWGAGRMREGPHVYSQPHLGALGFLAGASFRRPSTAWGIPSASRRARLRAMLRMRQQQHVKRNVGQC